QLGKGDLETNVGLCKASDLLERFAERGRRILHACRGTIWRAGGLLERPHGRERVVGGGVQLSIARPRVFVLKGVGLMSSDAEFVDAADRQRRSRTAERPRHRSRESDAAQRVALL